MSSPDSATIANLLSNGPHRSEAGHKQLTLAFCGLYIASTTTSTKPWLVWEAEKDYPRYYIPSESLHADIKSRLKDADSGSIRQNGHKVPETPVDSTEVEIVNGKGNKSQAFIERLVVGSRTTTWVRRDWVEKLAYIETDIDDWFENGAIFAGIKNLYKRIDTATVSQYIVVKINGEEVAESNAAVLLNETGLKGTYYLPATSIKNWGTVEKSDLKTYCPYKGEAWYLSINVKDKKYENLIWYYQYPTHESAALEGLVSFYSKDGVDILVDGRKV